MGGVIQAIIVQAHERLLVFLGDGGGVVLAVELCMIVLDVSSPLVSDTRCELGGLAWAWSVRGDDASTQRQVVRVVIFIDWSDKVSEWILVDVWEILGLRIFILGRIDAWGVGVGPVGVPDVGWHGGEDVLEHSERGAADR